MFARLIFILGVTTPSNFATTKFYRPLQVFSSCRDPTKAGFIIWWKPASSLDAKNCKPSVKIITLLHPFPSIWSLVYQSVQAHHGMSILQRNLAIDAMVPHSVQTLVGATQILKILAVCHGTQDKTATEVASQFSRMLRTSKVNRFSP